MIILSNFKRIAQNCQGQIDGASANFRLCADEPAAGVAELAVVGDDVPVLIRAEHRHGGAVRNFSDDRAGDGGGAAQVDRTARGGLRRAGPRGAGIDERQAEIRRQRLHKALGDGVDVVFDPLCVLVVVVVADLEQDGRKARLAHLAETRGGAGRHKLRQRVDLAQVLREKLRRAAAVRACGIVKGDDPAGLSLAPGAGGVGVDREIEVVAALIGLPDGGRGGHIGGVAGELDPVGEQIRLHRIGDEVHEIFLAPRAGDIRVILLRAGTEIHGRHGNRSPFRWFSHPMPPGARVQSPGGLFSAIKRRRQIARGNLSSWYG